MVDARCNYDRLINKNTKNNAPKLVKVGLAFGLICAMVGDNPNARVDPPLGYRAFIKVEESDDQRRQMVNIILSGELKAKGRDLVYAQGKENFKTDIWKGNESIIF